MKIKRVLELDVKTKKKMNSKKEKLNTYKEFHILTVEKANKDDVDKSFVEDEIDKSINDD